MYSENLDYLNLDLDNLDLNLDHLDPNLDFQNLQHRKKNLQHGKFIGPNLYGMDLQDMGRYLDLSLANLDLELDNLN